MIKLYNSLYNYFFPDYISKFHALNLESKIDITEIWEGYRMDLALPNCKIVVIASSYNKLFKKALLQLRIYGLLKTS